MDRELSVIISAVIYPEEGAFIAQGLEYDICAQGRTIAEVTKAFDKAVVANVAVCIELGRAPLDGIQPAPAKFWQMYKTAEVKIQPHGLEDEPVRLPMPAFMPEIRKKFRINESVAA